MTSSEIAVREAGTVAPQRDVVDGWKDVITDIVRLAETIHDTDFVPKGLRGNYAATAAAILAGREVGIGPMTSLQHMYVVEGRPTMSAKLMRARVLAAGHDLVYEENTITRCRVRGRRRGEQAWTTVEWTMDDAKRAGLAGKNTWQKYPRRMLQARATGELCDIVFPDVVAGMAVTEEAEDDAGDYAGVVDEAAEQQPTKRRTARRRTAAATPPPAPEPEPAAEGVTAVSPAEAREAPRAQVPEPPLPGEPGFEDTLPGMPSAPEAEEPQRPPAAAPEPLTRPQSRKIHALFNQIGWSDRADRLRASSTIVNRELNSSGDLTKDEAAVLIDTLERVINAGPDPDVRLGELLADIRDAAVDPEADEDAPDGDEPVDAEVVDDPESEDR
ncbi:hypothetical protein [Microbispora sp. CA-102843]|uniref:hypothetical protein n=1 Tax=Microbispora sp. CA-102843 TaxID=3239952 RepID=UPI003D8D7731